MEYKEYVTYSTVSHRYGSVPCLVFSLNNDEIRKDLTKYINLILQDEKLLELFETSWCRYQDEILDLCAIYIYDMHTRISERGGECLLIGPDLLLQCFYPNNHRRVYYANRRHQILTYFQIKKFKENYKVVHEIDFKNLITSCTSVINILGKCDSQCETHRHTECINVQLKENGFREIKEVILDGFSIMNTKYPRHLCKDYEESVKKKFKDHKISEWEFVRPHLTSRYSSKIVHSLREFESHQLTEDNITERAERYSVSAQKAAVSRKFIAQNCSDCYVLDYCRARYPAHYNYCAKKHTITEVHDLINSFDITKSGLSVYTDAELDIYNYLQNRRIKLRRNFTGSGSETVRTFKISHFMEGENIGLIRKINAREWEFITRNELFALTGFVPEHYTHFTNTWTDFAKRLLIISRQASAYGIMYGYYKNTETLCGLSLDQESNVASDILENYVFTAHISDKRDTYRFTRTIPAKDLMAHILVTL